MLQPIKVPTFGESIVEGTIVRWVKNVGEPVKGDEPLVEIETDKITVEVPSPSPGVLVQIDKKVGDKVQVGEIIGGVDEKGKAAVSEKVTATMVSPKVTLPAEKNQPVAMPSASLLAKEKNVDLAQVNGSGRNGRILKEDVLLAVEKSSLKPNVAPSAVVPLPSPVVVNTSVGDGQYRQERRVALTPLRQRIAERLLEAQSTAAILTTFNEVEMTAVMDLRKKYQDKFTEKYGIKLGFMGFFVKAVVEALKAFPAVNAEMTASDIIYKDYYDIGVAVGGGKGLVVPIIRNAERLNFADVEKTISDFAVKAKNNKLTLEDLKGGTFTISNGGIYGSMLSTPILNPPQSAILGMHNIQERAVVRDGQVTVRPMMYLALSYDHRIIDGREAVQCLIRIKECIENPERLLLAV